MNTTKLDFKLCCRIYKVFPNRFLSWNEIISKIQLLRATTSSLDHGRTFKELFLGRRRRKINEACSVGPTIFRISDLLMKPPKPETLSRIIFSNFCKLLVLSNLHNTKQLYCCKALPSQNKQENTRKTRLLAIPSSRLKILATVQKMPR